MDAPKKIWAWPHFDGWITGDWSANTYYDDRTVEYILATEHDRIVAEKDAEIVALESECNRWHADANLMLGFADLAYEAGVYPTSSELIAARDRAVAAIRRDARDEGVIDDS